MTKVCPKCNTPNLPEAAFCASCASPLPIGPAVGSPPNQQQWTPQSGQMIGQPPPAKSGASQRAIIALVLAIAALLCCGPFTGIPAAIVGWMELSAINLGQSSPSGRWMAQVGIWGGIICSILYIIFVGIWLLLSMMAGGGYY